MMNVPFRFPRPHYPYTNFYPLHKVHPFSPSVPQKSQFPSEIHGRPFSSTTQENKKSDTCKDSCQKECSCTENDSPVFHLFGLNLYSDDILILMLLFFLYKEDVKDPSLFLSLILLLLN